jgi:hypothetical protein
MQALLLLLQDNPAAIQGFIGGVLGAVVVNLIAWRWEVRRRKHTSAE